MAGPVPDLAPVVARLAARPGHEATRTALESLLRDGFGADFADIAHEVRMPDVRGRADMLFGSVVFEIKSDLRREIDDVARRMPDYLREREERTRRTFTGIATDGATFIAYERDGAGLREISRFAVNPDRPRDLLLWLEPALSGRFDLAPDALSITAMLGRASLTFGRARRVLDAAWGRLAGDPEVLLKRQLWDGLLREAYGSAVGDDALFLQHTYLTIVAKTIAAGVLDSKATEASAVLSGQALREAGIHGAVESDFFDWVLKDAAGGDLVLRVAREVARFRLHDVRTDVLKALYESLIDPAQRHDLGEYYTPDWLAAKVVAAAVEAPLDARVLDPACGSGTFLFHAVRRLLAAAHAAGLPPDEAVARCVEQVRGIDVHPVAVIIARVTWLLALGPAVQERRGDLRVPVFLGDALQWALKDTLDQADVRVPVSEGEPPLTMPAAFAETQERFDAGIRTLTDGMADDVSDDVMQRRLSAIPGIGAADAAAMTATFVRLRQLYRAGRDGIWPYVLDNLIRPLWLSRPAQRSDVIVGNPPWVAYRHLSPVMQGRLREASQRYDLWVGGVLTTQQDLCALFWARAIDLYLKPGGVIAFVLPYAALNRPAFRGLRSGGYDRLVRVRFLAAWSFDEAVQPLFPVPACVLIARRGTDGPLPATVTRYAGSLGRRDADETEADRRLRRTEDAPWPPIPSQP